MNCKYKSEICQDSGSMPGDFMTTKKQAVSPHDSGDLSSPFPAFILQLHAASTTTMIIQ